MKIAFISYSDSKGGASAAAFSIFNLIKNKKIKKSFFAVHKKFIKTKSIFGFLNRIYINIIRVLEKLVINFFLKNKFHQSLNIIKTNIFKKINIDDYDIINIHWINRSMVSLNEIYKIKKKTLISLHDMWFINATQHYSISKENNENKISKYCLNLKKKIFLKKNIYLIAHNKWMYQNAIKKWPILKDKIFLCNYYPINLKLFKPRNKKLLRKKYQIPTDKKIILFSAQDLCDYRKGYKFYLKIYNKLKHNNDLFFISVGKNNPQMKNFNNYKHFDFMSYKGMSEIYSLSDIYVCTSIIDNLPLSVLEAMASGALVMSFKNGGVIEVLKNNGYLFNINSTNKLIKKIKEIKFQEIKKKTKSSIEFSKKNFNKKTIQRNYENVLFKINKL